MAGAPPIGPHARPVPVRYTGPGLAAFLVFVGIATALQLRPNQVGRAEPEPEPEPRQEEAVPDLRPAPAKEAIVRAAASAPLPRLPTRQGPDARVLADELSNALRLLREAGQEPGQALAAVDEVRTALGVFDKELRSYRSVERAGGEQEQAETFARRADETRGLLQKAVVELHFAARQELDGDQGEQLHDTFAKTRAALHDAERALAAAVEAAAHAAPAPAADSAPSPR